MVHCGAIYDITAAEDAQRAANVEGTRAVIELARLDATLHHVSSIAVAGTFRGEYTEDDFDVAPGPAHAVSPDQVRGRAAGALDAGVCATASTGPAVVVGDSRTGEMDKVDGPYYFFGMLAKLARLPKFTPIVLPDTGRTNIVPVDYVVDALVALIHAPDPRRADVPPHRAESDRAARHLPWGCRGGRAAAAARLAAARRRDAVPAGHADAPRCCATWRPPSSAVPAEILDVVDLARRSPPTTPGSVARQRNRRSRSSRRTRRSCGGTGPSTSTPTGPAATIRPARWSGRHVIITGASSGIGRASAIAVAERGATVFALARNAEALDDLVAEIRAYGGQAYAFTCDVTDSASVDHTVKDILGRFGHVDYLVNNAGRSIRRSVVASTDRLHDYERVMAVNYFGAVRMVLALLPHWRERRFGHVVNVSSAGVQASNPKYSAYLPSKAALDAFADVVGTETLSDHITFTSIHMPLVRTPMIAPSRRLNPIPPISAEHAAAMVVRGAGREAGPDRHPVGTLADVGKYFTPKLSRRVLHQMYLGYPDSAAARG